MARLNLIMAVSAAALLLACGGSKGAGNGTVKDDPTSSKAAFAAMGKVLQHARCLNCHPSGDSPTQGDDLSAHQPPVFRGQGGLGAVGMRCNTCHTEENVPLLERPGSMPGARGWHLAPRSMGWQGKTLKEICVQLKDPAQNGGKTMAELHEHTLKDPFVGWAWEPGEGRAPAPGTREEFAANTLAWINSGAHCPDE